MTSANPAENRPLHSEPKASTGKEALDVFIKQLSDPHLRSYAEIDALFHEAASLIEQLGAENRELVLTEATCRLLAESWSRDIDLRQATEFLLALMAEVCLRYRNALVNVALTDRHTRNVRPNPNGGIRGIPGLTAVRALTGLHGSYTSDAAILASLGVEIAERACQAQAGGSSDV